MATTKYMAFDTREDAKKVLEAMRDVINRYAFVSQADLYELTGFPSTYADTKFGWTKLEKVRIRKTEKGYVINFPKMEVL